MTVGLHRVTYLDAASASHEWTCEVEEVTIRYGRDDPTGQPSASTASLTLPGVAPAALDIGSRVLVDTQPPGGAWTRRFTGKVTDLSTTWGLGFDPVDGAGVVPKAEVTCVGPLADLGRRYVGAEPWPQEKDGARVGRILGLAVDPATVGQVDPGAVDILARDVDHESAQDLLESVGTDAGGILWETRGGMISYADSEHRRGTPVTVQLGACDVLLAPVWSRTVAGLVNDVSIGYGVAAGGAEQPRAVATRADSIATYGRYAYTTSTQLAVLADAQARAQMLVVRSGVPSWDISQLPVDLSIIDAVRTPMILALNMHSLLSVTGLPVGSPATTAQLWVEGWTEHLAYGVHEITFSVTAYCRTAPAPRWDDVDAGWTWDTMPATLTWDATTCLGPVPSSGRWADVPASLRWDEVPAATTWNTWKG